MAFNFQDGWSQDAYDRHVNGPVTDTDDTEEYLYPPLDCGHDSATFISMPDGQYLCSDCAALSNLPNMS